jgi:hypothetical protein
VQVIQLFGREVIVDNCLDQVSTTNQSDSLGIQ